MININAIKQNLKQTRQNPLSHDLCKQNLHNGKTAKIANANLPDAKKNKKDEFYAQLSDIEMSQSKRAFQR